ncbi:uncharacterized protein H6S33_001018 [Morchella sextelata]|uniref:uncharacterized protein n=1 Tax=Morchella sextelata TaxID=1174677 RepID=UPI001D053C5E|nr:uncharacterized protein H6S33_001018 [Morchella sextelata]KAH0608790.1 hypothetical protein H6S33_001018 [Morchella sextelata]
MSFGVSIGDVLLITKIGFKLWVNVSGAKKEREDLTADLMKLKAREQLSEALATLNVLEQLNRKLVKGRSFRRAAWEVRGRERFQEYRSKLERGLATIDMLFLSGSMKMVTDEVRETNVVLKRVENGMKYVGFSPDHDPIRFIDALNGQRLLPWELCLKWEDFRSLIQMSFKESAGKSFVERGEYDIVNEESGALMRMEDWRNNIRPGILLSMAIVVRKKIEKGENDYRCPACKTEYTGSVGTGYQLERVNCTYCKRWFQITSQITVVEIDPDATEQQNGLSSNSGEPSKDDDLMHIQRFHIRAQTGVSRPHTAEDFDDVLTVVSRPHTAEDFDDVLTGVSRPHTAEDFDDVLTVYSWG